MRPRNLLTAAPLVLAGVLAAIPIIRACAPEGPTLAFTWERHPDLPLNDFAAGKLGVLQPTYARSYLVVAYRHLTGAPLTRAERAGALALWEARLQGGAQLPHAPKAAAPEDRALRDWTATRARFTKAPQPEPSRFQWNATFYRPVVSDNALEVASDTLQDRARRWKPAWVQEWIRTQDKVFSTNGSARMAPDPVPAGRDALFLKDRAYQVASAHFYAGDFQAARDAFQAIRDDASSPWRRLAAYLVGRCWLREGAVAPPGERATVCFKEAHRTFEELTRRGLPPRPACEAPEPLPETELLAAIEVAAFQSWAKGAPAEAGAALASGLLGRTPCRDYGDALGRYSNLLDAQIAGENTWGDDRARPRSITPGLLGNDLTEWVYRFRDTGPKAYAAAFDRWTRTRSLPWLVMALANGEPSSRGIDEVLEAGAQVKGDHPGHETIAFHRARILAASGRAAEARELMNAFLDRPGAATPSSLNLWRALRMPLAATPAAFLADALRVPAGSYGLGGEVSRAHRSLTTWDAGTQATHPDVRALLKVVQPPPRFIQGDAARILNLATPADVLLGLARNPALPDHLRREWRRAAWVRAVLLEQWDLAAEATPDLVEGEPGLGSALAGFAQAPRDEKERLALMALLSHPGLRWRVYQGINRRTFTEPGAKPIPLRHRDTYLAASWWPGPKGNGRGQTDKVEESYIWGSYFYYPQPHAMEVPLFNLAGTRLPALPWLTPAQRDRGEAEGKALQALAEGPDWLNERTLAWARREPEDPRIPEALHYAVVAEKVGGEKRLGKICYRLLHGKYKASPWAGRTPIHY